MDDLICYKRMPQWTAATLPETVKAKHNTKIGTWGKITILSGALKFYELSETDEVLATHIFTSETETPFVVPQAWHKVEALSDDLVMQLDFYCRPEDYWTKKYDLGKTHSEVVAAMAQVPLGRALDLGCGRGRNALYLAQRGFEVTAVDQNPNALEILQSIVEAEDLDMRVGLYDIEDANLQTTYDFIVSTVVLMFLNAARVPDIIQNMQAQTAPGGYNLIVCAMDTDDAPCPMPFPFTFKSGELYDYYTGWTMVKYNEDFGHLHRRDENGNPIRLRFATMLSRKPL